MPEIIRDLITHTIITYNSSAISTDGVEPISPSEMGGFYNKAFDELLEELSHHEWIDGDISQVPDEDLESVQKLINSIVLHAFSMR